MFCHLTLQGEPAPKREPEVSLTSSQSRLSSSIPLVRRGRVGVWGVGGQDTFTIRNSCEAHSFCGSLHVSPQEDVFFFPRIMSGVWTAGSGALRPAKTEEWYWLGQVDAFS